jgi:hypothetical protein
MDSPGKGFGEVDMTGHGKLRNIGIVVVVGIAALGVYTLGIYQWVLHRQSHRERQEILRLEKIRRKESQEDESIINSKSGFTG